MALPRIGDVRTVNQIGNRRPFEILSFWIDCSGKASHGVKCTRAIQDINIQESDQPQPELSSDAHNVPILNDERICDRVERDHLLEKIKVIVSNGSVGEVGDGCVSRPRDNGDQQDTGDNRTSDFVCQENSSEEASAKDADPHSRIPHLG